MKAIALATVVCVAGLAAGGSGATIGATGTLGGTTQISFGCPGPVSDSGPTCHPWHLFPNARFSISRRSTDGSNANARFHLRLDAGAYLVTPLPQHSTRGGSRITVRVRAGAVTTAVVKFVGYPQME